MSGGAPRRRWGVGWGEEEEAVVRGVERVESRGVLGLLC